MTQKYIKDKIDSIFCQLRFDKNHHLGLGDIRLTIDQQNMILNLIEEDQPVQNDFPDIDFRRDIAEELSRDELIERLCEMHETYKAMREEWFNKTQLNQPTTEESKVVRTAEEILRGCDQFMDDHFGYCIPKTDVLKAMEESKKQGFVLPTIEEIEQWAKDESTKHNGKSIQWIDHDKKHNLILGAKWVINKFKL